MKISLSRQFIIILSIPILVIMVSTCIVLSYTWQKQNETQINQCNCTIDGINLNITALTSNMQKTGRLFASSKETQDFLLNASIDMSDLPRQSFSDSIEGTKFCVSDLTDIILWNQKSTLSLVSYISLDMERFVTGHLNSEGAEQNYFRFYTNPQNQQIYIMYFAPIYVNSFSKSFGTRIGEVVIICKPRVLPELIDSVTDINLTITDTSTTEVLYQSIDNTGPDDRILYQASQPVSYTDLKITGTIYSDSSALFSNHYMLFILLLIILSAIYVLYLAVAIQRIIIRPIYRLNAQIEELDHAQNTIRLDETAENEIGSIATRINELLAKISSLNQKNISVQTRLYEMEISKRQTQLYAYQSQINPHFLYNMLQCMRGISLMHGMKQIALICTNMAVLFRYSIKGKNFVKLQEELDIIDKYLYMIAVRFQDRISYMLKVSGEVKECAIPKMILQPLVENAIFHGLEPIDRPGKLEIICDLKEGALIINIKDNGIGFDKDKLGELNRILHAEIPGDIYADFDETKGLGIINIHNKIRLYEGSKYGLSVYRRQDCTVVTVRLDPELELLS